MFKCPTCGGDTLTGKCHCKKQCPVCHEMTLDPEDTEPVEQLDLFRETMATEPAFYSMP